MSRRPGLGVSPSAETEALYNAAIEGLVAGPADFVGRELELARATSIVRETSTHGFGALVVRGPAGIGKTAFCREVARIAQAIARHWLAAEQPDDAVEWLRSAARQAMQLGAFSDARKHLSPVLEHDPQHAAALRINAEALDMIGDPRALAAYDAAIAVAGPTDTGDLIAMRALTQIKQGDPRGALLAIAGAKPTSITGRLSEALAYAGAAALGSVPSSTRRSTSPG